jgi:hypothetical protein
MCKKIDNKEIEIHLLLFRVHKEHKIPAIYQWKNRNQLANPQLIMK